MKVIFGILILLSVNSFADGRRIVFSVAAPMPTTYSATDSKSLVASELQTVKGLDIYNYSMYDIDCVWHQSSLTAPNGLTAGGQVQKGFSLVASEHVTMPGIQGGKNLYCKGTNAAPTVGTFIINTW